MIVYTIAALTFERYYCVREKKLNRKVARRYILIYIISLWTLAICYALPGTLSVVLRRHEESDYCDSLLSDSFLKIYISSKFIVCFAFPYAVLIVFSIMLLVFLKNWSDKAKRLNLTTSCGEATINLEQTETALHTLFIDKDNETSNYESIRSQSLLRSKTSKQTKNTKTKKNKREIIKRRSTRFVLAIVSSFLCCWSPLWIFQLINLILQNTYEPEWLKIMNNINIILVYLGGALNPLLFMLLTENFRELVFKKILEKFKN